MSGPADDPNLYLKYRSLPILATITGTYPVSGYWDIGPKGNDIFTVCNCGSCLAAADNGYAGGAGGVLCW